jgi:hypothetical protein
MKEEDEAVYATTSHAGIAGTFLAGTLQILGSIGAATRRARSGNLFVDRVKANYCGVHIWDLC